MPETKEEIPTHNREIAAFYITNEKPDSVLFIDTTGLAQTTVKLFEGIGEEGLGDGTAAWEALEERLNSATKKLRRGLNDKLTSRTGQTGRSPVRCFAQDGPLKTAPWTNWGN